jgi:hypothetical protein
MSNHFKFAGDGPRLDLTDLYVFASPEKLGLARTPRKRSANRTTGNSNS